MMEKVDEDGDAGSDGDGGGGGWWFSFALGVPTSYLLPLTSFLFPLYLNTHLMMIDHG